MMDYLTLRFSVLLRIPVIIAFLILVEGCTVSVPEFSGEAAFKYLEKKVNGHFRQIIEVDNNYFVVEFVEKKVYD